MKKPRGRPPKTEVDRKSMDLRIPVTESQKALILEAARAAGQDMAGWARTLLIEAAERVNEEVGKPK